MDPLRQQVSLMVLHHMGEHVLSRRRKQPFRSLIEEDPYENPGNYVLELNKIKWKQK